VKLKNPEIEKNLVVSTVHISKKDNDLLENASKHPLSREGICLCLDEFEYGYRIFVGTREHKADALINQKHLTDLGFSKEFCDLIQITYDLKCKFHCLDCDGPVYDGLNKFDWEE
jgi:hypothetical protein